MDRLGVRRALVGHVAAREYHPAVGNAELLEELAGHPRLHPCWAVLPHQTGEMSEPAALVSEMRRHGVRAARVFPGVSRGWGHRFSLDRYVSGPLLTALEGAGIPVLVDYLLFRRDELDWREIADVCERHPGLKLVLIRAGGRSARNLYPMMDAFPNLHVGTAGYAVHRGLEALCERFGPGRLLFGSGFPYWSLGGAVFQLAHARIPLQAKRQIASGNLRRLLGVAAEGRDVGVPA